MMQVSSYLNAVLKHTAINAWGLFWLISIPVSVAIAAEMFASDLSSGDGVSHMISYFRALCRAAHFSWLSPPSSLAGFVFRATCDVVVAQSKIPWPVFCRCHGMAGSFHLHNVIRFFVTIITQTFYLLRDEIEGSVGYIFLAAMVLTSFRFGSKHLSQEQWRLLHKTGLYFLWAYPFSVYWWNSVHYYGTPALIDYVFYWMGFAAFALRIAAWGKQRDNRASPALKVFGSLAIAVGLLVSASGQYWQKAVSGVSERATVVSRSRVVVSVLAVRTVPVAAYHWLRRLVINESQNPGLALRDYSRTACG